MFVIHAIWDHHADGGKLHFWAESSQLPLTLPASAGRKAGNRQSQGQQKQQKQQKPLEHPFALQYEPLRQALGELVGRLQIAAGEASSLELRLPSTGKGPLPSPELILEEEGELQPVAFASYEVPVLALTAEAGFDALLALPDHPPHGVAFGAALRFWVTAARFAYELIARQSYMPSLDESRQNGETTVRAVWTAVLAPEDAERERQLALMMPALCWSWLPPGERRTTLPQAMLHQFLNACIDAFVRGSLVATGLLSSAPAMPKRRTVSYTLPEHWLRALASDDPRLAVSENERKQFVTAIQTWLGQLQPRGEEAPFRTCFRLDPPSEEDGHDATWHVNYFLQANDDRSLLVPAEMVWRERSSTLTFLKRSFENPQERLLADLGRASRLFPAIEESLREARPHGLNLQTEQAYAFLRESAPLLEQSGFGVLVPPWWQKASARLGVKLKMKAKGAVVSSGLMGLDSIVEYDWTVAVGDTMLSAEEFENLVRLKVPLVKVRGQWVELRPEEIEKAIAFLKKKHGGNGQMRLGEALRTGLGREESELGLPVVDVEGEGWIGDLLQHLSDGAKIELIDPPTAFQGKLRPYQVRGTSWLAFLRRYGLGGCLADDMGLGKCLGACSLVTVNGFLRKAEEIWTRYAGEAIFDGEGYWAEPAEQLLTNSIDEASGKIVQTRIKRLYRQHVSERLRTVRLENNRSVTITQRHKLLTDKGWANELHVGDYVCVPAKLVWDGNQDVFYCRIKGIEDVQYDGWVYDFEVEDHHNFVADGILCHNTIQFISLLLHDREVSKPEDTAQRNPALLICPMSIVGNWHRELQRFAPSLKVMIHHGHERLAGEAFAAEAMQNDVVITTYALALRDREHLAPIEWEYAVVDEAQNIKNEAAKQSQAIKALNARHKIALTGTPVENRLSELWSIMEFVNPGYLGSATEFRQQYAIPIERYHEAERAERLKRVIQPFVLRRLKTDKSIIADLPDKMEMRVYCNLTREQATLYEAVVKEMMEKIEESEGMERRGLVLATLMKLKQICNHPAQFVGDGSALPGRSGKLARLEEMLEEVLATGDKALIFSQFAEMGGLLRRHLQERLDCEVLFLHGGTPKKLRDSMVQRFQEPCRPGAGSASSPPIFILSLKAGGVGLNLTAANHVFHFDRWWNPAVENQATDRAFRIGQRKNVQVHKFVCVGTLEERIDQMIEQKKELAESIVGSGEAWLTEMSNAELKELFALSREAVAE